MRPDSHKPPRLNDITWDGGRASTVQFMCVLPHDSSLPILKNTTVEVRISVYEFQGHHLQTENTDIILFSTSYIFMLGTLGCVATLPSYCLKYQNTQSTA